MIKRVPVTEAKWVDIGDITLYNKDGVHVGIVKIQTAEYVWENPHKFPFGTQFIIGMARKHPDATVSYLNYDDGESKGWCKIKNIFVEVVA